MYAVIQTGGKQYLVKANDTLQVERLNGEKGDRIEIPKVLALSDGTNLRAWLYKIATNVAYAHLKKRTRHQWKITDLTDLNASVHAYNLDEKEQMEAVLLAIKQLPFKQQFALLLRNYQDCSYEEIGAALECSPESARANVYQGLRRLRRELTEDLV